MTPLGSGDQMKDDKNILTMDKNVKVADTSGVPSLYIKQEGMTGKVYKLTIQVNKVRAPPGPKSKKLAMMIATRRKLRGIKNPPLSPTSAPAAHSSVASPQIPRSLSVSPGKKPSSPAFASVLNKTVKCTVCTEYFDTPRNMYLHRKVHNICGYCDTPCETRTQCLYHEKLHIGTDPTNPFKCHMCFKAFDKRKSLKDHTRMFHMEQNLEDGDSLNYVDYEELDASVTEYQCETCKTVLHDAESYRNHIKIHEMSIKTAKPQRYTCGIASEDYENSMDHEQLTPEEEHECNICKKSFQNEESLSLHLAHHLSRAHHCNICRKAFINRTTLAVHMKTHKNMKNPL